MKWILVYVFYKTNICKLQGSDYNRDSNIILYVITMIVTKCDKYYRVGYTCYSHSYNIILYKEGYRKFVKYSLHLII